MFRRTVETQIEIDADARIVWDALTNLELYPEWNPMLRRATGRVEKGERLTLYFNPPGGKLRVFKPKLIVVDIEKELRWLGVPGAPLLFESEHYFLLEKTGPNATRLTHNMLFYGLLIPPMWGWIKSKTQGPFELMNEAHKRRAESLAISAGH